MEHLETYEGKLFFIFGDGSTVTVKRKGFKMGLLTVETIATIHVIDAYNYLGGVEFHKKTSPAEKVEIAEWVGMVNRQAREPEEKDRWGVPLSELDFDPITLEALESWGLETLEDLQDAILSGAIYENGAGEYIIKDCLKILLGVEK